MVFVTHTFELPCISKAVPEHRPYQCLNCVLEPRCTAATITTVEMQSLFTLASTLLLVLSKAFAIETFIIQKMQSLASSSSLLLPHFIFLVTAMQATAHGMYLVHSAFPGTNHVKNCQVPLLASSAPS